tara:strand:- start:31 stop:468 length:438 start_codon:yes stop_codon:yes gene_type:complete
MEDREKALGISDLITIFLPFTMAISGLLLITMGVYFYLFPENEQSVTALIPAAIGMGLLIPGIITITAPHNKKHAMHAGATFALIGTLGGLMGISDFISYFTAGVDLERATIARMAMLLLCGETLVGSIMSFRLARIKREQEAQN